MHPTQYHDVDAARHSSGKLITRGPSPSLWEKYRCPWLEAICNPTLGLGVFDDFDCMPIELTKYTIDVSDDKASVTQVALPYGVTRLELTGDVDEELFVHYGSVACTHAHIDSGEGKVWFETRIRSSSIANGVSWFIGLGTALAAGDDVYQQGNAAHCELVVNGLDFVGFSVLGDDGDAVRAIYKTAGAAVTEAVAAVPLLSSTGTIVADRWHKLGFYFDGLSVLKWFFDGVEYGTTVAETATNFPDNTGLCFVAGAKLKTSQALSLDIDWWRCFQETPQG